VQVKTKQTFVIALVVLLTAAIWYQYVYASAQHSISDANGKAADLISQAKAERAQLESPSSHTKKSNTGQITSDQLQAAVPDTPQLTGVLRDLEALKVKDGIGWSTITPSTPTVAGALSSTNVAITVGGSYPAVHNFVDDVLSMKRFALVDSISWSEGAPAGTTSSATPTGAVASGPPSGHIFGAPGGTPDLSVQMTIRVFNVVPGISATGTVNGAVPTGSSGASATPSGSSSATPGH
jgi:Tfp pilus assembly protein PilO